MLAPTIHLNGTSQTQLADEYLAAMEALREASDALAEITINARDYYPQGAAAFQIANNRRAEMLNQLATYSAELMAVVESIYADE